MRLGWVILQVSKYLGQPLPEFGIGALELGQTAPEVIRGKQRVAHASRPNSSMSCCAVTRRTRPAAASSNEVFTRAR